MELVNSEFRILNSFQDENLKFRLTSIRFFSMYLKQKLRVPTSLILHSNLKSRIWNPEFGIQNSEFITLNPQYFLYYNPYFDRYDEHFS